MTEVLDGQLVEQPFEPAPPLRVVDVQRLEDGQDVFFHRQLAKDRWLLRQVPDSGPGTQIHRQCRDVALVEPDGAFVGPNQPGDHVERRRLPRPVRSQQADDFALREVQRHVVDHAAALVGLHQVLRLEPAAAAHGSMLAGHRLAARDGLLGELEEMLRRGIAVRRHAVPDLGRKGHGHVAPQRAHRQHEHLEHRQPGKHGGREVGTRLVDRQVPGVRRLSLGVRAQLQELLPVGDRQIGERGTPLIVGDPREGGRRERER